MAGRVLNICLLLALCVLLGLNWALRPDAARTNSEFLPEMVRTARYNAFAPNPNFADGKTLQHPAPGTIPRDEPPLHYRATPEDAVRAGQELQSPIAAGDARALQRGTVLFANFCQPCHGPGGRGDGLVVQRGFPAPPSLLAEQALKLPDGQIFHILTYGRVNMASYASQLSREDRWKVIRFVRSLQGQVAVAPQGEQK